MKRAILGFLAGLIGWVVVASVLDRILRVAIPGYALAEPQLHFTLAMMFARLLLGVLASLAAGALVRWVAPREVRVSLVLGIVILLAFVPVHFKIWNALPVWYHLTFLISIVPCVLMGSRLARRKISP